jgi:hypothetical protein
LIAKVYDFESGGRINNVEDLLLGVNADGAASVVKNSFHGEAI